VENWLRIANGKRTLVFACTKSHGAALLQEFLQAGIAAELLTDQDSEPDREAAIYRLEAGSTKVLINCFLLSYGVDVPAVECVVLARPTRSVTLYLQAVGRGMRPAPGKEHVVLIDHGRVVESLGMPDAEFGWSLDDINVNTRAHGEVAARRQSEEQHRTCPECLHLWLVSEDGPACASCGWMPAPNPKAVPFTDAELREINAEVSAQDTAAVERFYQEALGWYAQRWPGRWMHREKSARWAAWMWTRKRFVLNAERPPPKFWNISLAQPGMEASGWLKSRLIAYQRRRGQTVCA
jgi:DNA repair protein RadD